MADDSEAWRGEPEESEAMGMSPFMSMFSMQPLTTEQKAAYAAEQKQKKAEAEMRSLLVSPFKPEARCAKCGHEAAKVRHCEGGDAYLHGACFAQTAGKEHFHRTCKQCRYVWYEWPLDA